MNKLYNLFIMFHQAEITNNISNISFLN